MRDREKEWKRQRDRGVRKIKREERGRKERGGGKKNKEKTLQKSYTDRQKSNQRQKESWRGRDGNINRRIYRQIKVCGNAPLYIQFIVQATIYIKYIMYNIYYYIYEE